MYRDFKQIDLHMHSTVSDGTDTPEEILEKVKEAGITCFSLTDHDAVKGCRIIRSLLTKDDPQFISGVEFSCKDENGQYHILGYGFDPQAPSILEAVAAAHGFRMHKVEARLAFLKQRFGFTFAKEDIARLLKRDNPGKPHIGNLMVKYGYAPTKEEAINRYINLLHIPDKYLVPQTAIAAIRDAGGIPVLAHPSYGSGDQIIVGDDMDRRLRRLMEYGLQGVEAFYSGFTTKLQNEMLQFAEKYDLYVTAGSDYHGKNKMIALGDTNLQTASDDPEGLQKFLSAVFSRQTG